MNKTSLLIVFVFVFGVITTNCKKDDPKVDPIVEETGVALAPKINGLNITTVGYIDLEGGKVYSYSELSATVKPLIDVIYFKDQFWANDDKIGSISPTSLFGNGTGTNFKETTITTHQFDTATKDGILSPFTASEPAILAFKDKVIFFQTKSGKKGLIKINNVTTGVSVNFDLLITK